MNPNGELLFDHDAGSRTRRLPSSRSEGDSRWSRRRSRINILFLVGIRVLMIHVAPAASARVTASLLSAEPTT